MLRGLHEDQGDLNVYPFEGIVIDVEDLFTPCVKAW